MWEEAVVIYPTRCLLTLRKTTNIIAREFGSQFDLNLDPPEKEVGVLPTYWWNSSLRHHLMAIQISLTDQSAAGVVQCYQFIDRGQTVML